MNRLMVKAASAVLAAALPFAVCAQEMKPGNYRTSMTTDMPGAADKPMIEDKCVTQKDIDGGLTQLGAEKDNKACKISDFKRSPGRVSYRVTCPEAKTTTDAEGTFGAESFDFRMVSKMQEFPKPITFRIAGKRTGNCK